PVLVAIGTKPTLATRAVISTVRKHVRHAFSTAADAGSPSLSRLPRNETRIMPLSTDTPDSVMKPTAAETEIGISRTHSVSTPPTQANGTLAKTNAVSTTLRYVKYSRTTIIANAAGTTTIRRLRARSMFSNWPPQSRE